MPPQRVALLSADHRLVARLRRACAALGYEVRATPLAAFAAGATSEDAQILVLDMRCAASPSVLTSGLLGAALPSVAFVEGEQGARAEELLRVGFDAVLVAPLSPAAVHAAVTTARIRCEERQHRGVEEHRVRTLAMLSEVATSGQDVQGICQAAVDQLVARFGYDLVSIYLLEGGHLTLQAVHGYSYHYDTIPIDRGVLARTVRLGLPQLILTEGDAEFLAAADGIVAELCVPVLVGDRAIGGINVEARREGVLDTQALDVLILLARQLAMLLENARLQSESHRRVRDLSWLEQSTRELLLCETTGDVARVATEGIRRGLGADRARLFLASRDWQYLYDPLRGAGGQGNLADRATSLDPDGPLWQYPPGRAILRDGVDYAISDHAWEECPPALQGWLDGQVREQVLIALRDPQGSTGSVAGMIVVDSLTSGRTLNGARLTGISTYASQVTMALDRAKLIDAERRRIRIAQALERATAILSASLDSSQIYKQVLGLFSGVVDFDTATMLLIEEGVARPVGEWKLHYNPFGCNSEGFPAHEDPIISAWLRDGRQEPELIPDTREDPRWAVLGSHNGDYIDSIRCYLGAPLLIDGRIVGALSLGNYLPATFDQIAVSAAAEFAERLVRALRNARLYDVERAANARLQALVQLQDDFVATVSHELRTPLTSILGFSENLLTYWSRVNDGQRHASVEKIQRASLRLDRLVRDLLHISRMDAGAIHLNLGQQALAPLLEQSIEDLQVRYAGQVVLIDPATIAAQVWADAERLQQVAGNLLDNAAKYSPEGSPIAVLWHVQDGYGTLSFRDSGHGIRPEAEPLLFRRFGKLDGSIRAGHIGTGLGLYICKQFVHAMGGQIWHERPADDLGGAMFCVRLPLTAKAGAVEHSYSPPASTSGGVPAAAGGERHGVEHSYSPPASTRAVGEVHSAGVSSPRSP